MKQQQVSDHKLLVVRTCDARQVTRIGGTQRRKFVEADIKAAQKVRQDKTAEERAKLGETLRTANVSLRRFER